MSIPPPYTVSVLLLIVIGLVSQIERLFTVRFWGSVVVKLPLLNMEKTMSLPPAGARELIQFPASVQLAELPPVQNSVLFGA